MYDINVAKTKINASQGKYGVQNFWSDWRESLHFSFQDKNQFGRRNLSDYDRSTLALKLKPVIAAKAKAKQLSTLKQNANADRQIFAHREEISDKKVSADDSKTNAQIAEQAGVSRETIRKVEKIEQQATPEIKAALKILTLKTVICHCYKNLVGALNWEWLFLLKFESKAFFHFLRTSKKMA